MPRPAVEILGPWLHNKGNALMLEAAAERLGGRYVLAASSTLGMDALPERPALHRIKWSPTSGEIAGTVRAGALRSTYRLLRRRAGLTLASPAALHAKRLVDGQDLVALFDCSGFAYGDQWTTNRLENRIVYYDKLKARGLKLVMLPQALGPFQKEAMRACAQALFSRFDLIFARDATSRQHVLSLGFEEEEVEAVPDITHLLAGVPPADPEAWASRVCVVPNARMLDKTSRDVSAGYIGFVVRCIGQVRKAGLEPVIVLHESNDGALVQEVQSRLDTDVRVFDEDARITKGFLGACYANIGSRYHSLVSSLSQATPSVGTSWSHKYNAMFDEYGCAEWLISPDEDGPAVEEKLGRFLAPQHRAALHEQLTTAAERQKSKVERMWQRVEDVLQPSAVPA